MPFGGIQLLLYTINESKLDNLAEEKALFKVKDSDPSATNQLDSQMTVPYLKIGAQVMLLKNIYKWSSWSCDQLREECSHCQI